MTYMRPVRRRQVKRSPNAKEVLSPEFITAYGERCCQALQPCIRRDLPADTQIFCLVRVERAPEACHRLLPRKNWRKIRLELSTFDGVLIVAKTRMGGGACIGALSTSGQSLRLMPNPAKQLDGFNLEYSVGDVYTLLDYEFPTDLTPPHIENVIVRDKRFERFEEDPSEPILKLVTPKEGGLKFSTTA